MIPSGRSRFVIRFASDSVLGIQPGAQVDELAAFRTEGKELRSLVAILLRGLHNSFASGALELAVQPGLVAVKLLILEFHTLSQNAWI